jgi:hypothetical protein
VHRSVDALIKPRLEDPKTTEWIGTRPMENELKANLDRLLKKKKFSNFIEVGVNVLRSREKPGLNSLYNFLSDLAINDPQVLARLVSPLVKWIPLPDLFDLDRHILTTACLEPGEEILLAFFGDVMDNNSVMEGSRVYITRYRFIVVGKRKVKASVGDHIAGVFIAGASGRTIAADENLEIMTALFNMTRNLGAGTHGISYPFSGCELTKDGHVYTYKIKVPAAYFNNRIRSQTIEAYFAPMREPAQPEGDYLAVQQLLSKTLLNVLKAQKKAVESPDSDLALKF